MYLRLLDVVSRRPDTLLVDSADGRVDESYAALVAAIETARTSASP
jgi:hypothetical protein